MSCVPKDKIQWIATLTVEQTTSIRLLKFPHQSTTGWAAEIVTLYPSTEAKRSRGKHGWAPIVLRGAAYSHSFCELREGLGMLSGMSS